MKAKHFLYPLLGVLIAAIAFYAGSNFSLFKIEEKEQATVLLEKVKKVCKLVAVEGYFTEIYDYKQNNLFDAPGLFNKKALIRIKAKASIGYDFEQLEITVHEGTNTIYIDNIPEPELLSLEHDLDYYDMQESLFNTFSAEDLTKINKNAKAFITEKATDSPLLLAAEQQKSDLLEMIELAVKGSGWNFEVGKPKVLLD